MDKRYDSESLRAHLNDRLAQYSRDAKTLRSLRHATPAGSLIRYGALAAAIPLAAAGTASAQCEGGLTLTLSASTYASSIQSFLINSVPLRVAYYNYPNILNAPGLSLIGSTAMYFLISGGSSAVNLPSAFNVTNGLPTFGPFARLCTYAFGTAAGNFCPPASGFVGIRNQGNSAPGWMELSIASAGGGSVTVQILERGFEIDGNNSAITGDCASLDISTPVELTSFQALIDDQAVELAWETASELNNAGFELQRAEQNSSFEKLSFVEGFGTTTEPRSYHYRDESVKPNVQYRYRLMQIDLDGTTTFSEIIEVFTEDPSQIALSEFYPNPVSTGQTRFEINVAGPVQASVEVYDVRGALVESTDHMLNAGQNRLRLDTGKLATGPHFAKFQVGERVLYRKFVVIR